MPIADDREPARREVVRQAGAGDGEPRGQGRGREVGQLAGDVLQRQHPGQVAGRELQQAGAVRRPQPGQHLGSGARAPGDAVRPGQAGADDVEQPRLQAEQARPAGHDVVVDQVVPELGVRDEVVAEGGADAEDGEQPATQPGRGAQGREQRVGVGGRLAQPLEGGDGEVGLGGVGQRLDESRVGGAVVVPQAAPTRSPRSAAATSAKPSRSRAPTLLVRRPRPGAVTR